MKSTQLLALSLVLIATGCGSTPRATGGPDTQWGYGDNDWGTVDASFSACSDGLWQSPIDIRPRMTMLSGESVVDFDYETVNCTAVDDGRVVTLDIEPGHGFYDGFRRFELRELTFRSPSEHTLDGVSLPLEAQLLHKSDNGQLVALSILFQAGADNACVDAVLDDLPRANSKPRAVGGGLDLSALLPADTHYFRYDGSLTVPPCTEGVTWYVLASPVEASTASIDSFAKRFGGNVRPTQALNDRLVREFEALR